MHISNQGSNFQYSRSSPQGQERLEQFPLCQVHKWNIFLSHLFRNYYIHHETKATILHWSAPKITIIYESRRIFAFISMIPPENMKPSCGEITFGHARIGRIKHKHLSKRKFTASHIFYSSLIFCFLDWEH